MVEVGATESIPGTIGACDGSSVVGVAVRGLGNTAGMMDTKEGLLDGISVTFIGSIVGVLVGTVVGTDALKCLQVFSTDATVYP